MQVLRSARYFARAGTLHITWQDDQTMQHGTDAGKQTRTFHFGDWKPRRAPPTLQGDSVAEWVRGGGGGAPRTDP